MDFDEWSASRSDSFNFSWRYVDDYKNERLYGFLALLGCGIGSFPIRRVDSLQYLLVIPGESILFSYASRLHRWLMRHHPRSQN